MTGNLVRVLVVDDDPEVREALLTSLEAKKGYKVHCAANGAEAIAFLDHERATSPNKAPIDVVVTDWMMQDVDGIQLLAKLRETGNSTIPVVIISGAVERDMLNFARQLDADETLAKPFKLEALCRKMDSAIAKRRNKK